MQNKLLYFIFHLNKNREMIMQNYSIWIALTAAIAGILFGYDTGVMSGAILFISQEFPLTAGMNGIVVSSVLFGALLGALVSGWSSDYLGRKKLLIITACAFVLGSIETAFAASIFWLIVGRVFIGFAIGIASYIAPLYISEVSPAKHRGALVSLNQLAVSIGILLSYIVNYYCASYVPSDEWRWMLGLGMIPAILLLLGMFFLPDSPRWILSKGREEEARKILSKIRHTSQEIDDEVAEIKRTLKESFAHWPLLFSKRIRPAVITGFGLALVQQITGINTILYYAPTILTMSGFETATAAIFATMGIGVVFVLFTLLSLKLIDSLGRRPLLFIGLAGMAIGLALLSWIFENPSRSTIQSLAVSSMLLYIASFAISLGPIVWLMISEVYPLKIRGIGASFATCVNWSSNLLVTASFLTFIEYMGISGTFALYFVVTLLSILFVYFYVPETKGISLEMIEEQLMEGKCWRQLGNDQDKKFKNEWKQTFEA